MSKLETNAVAAGGPADDFPVAELNLGKALVLIHRLLPLLTEADHALHVQSALRRAGAFIESARQAHAHDMGVAISSDAQTSVESETVAVIAAAIAVLLGRPYKLVSVQPVQPAVAPQSAWAMEGRMQIFQSHKIR